MSNINIIVTLAAQCHPQTRRLACPTTKQGLDTFYYVYENRGLIIPMRLHIDGAMAYNWWQCGMFSYNNDGLAYVNRLQLSLVKHPDRDQENPRRG